MRDLCALDDIPDGGARGFGASPGGFTGLFAVRRGERVFAYVNSCPHVGVSLDWAPHQFLSRDGAQIVCATHGAMFEIETGRCMEGPCGGQALEAVEVRIEGGRILVPEDAGL